MTRTEAKQTARHQRRQQDEVEAQREEDERHQDRWAMANVRETP
jgi:hypothetical protein